MNEELLTLQDLMSTIKRYRWVIVGSVAFCTASSFGISAMLSKKYKSQALLNIQSTYFDVPLVGESIVGSRESTEMGSQKQALLRLALNDEFIDKEGEKYRVYKSEKGTSDRIIERDILRKNLDYFPSTATTFQITAIGKTADMAFGLATDALDQIVSTLVSERQKSMRTYRESLRKQLESLGIALSAAGGPSAGARPQVLKEELRMLESRVAALQAQYTSDHPTVVAMRQKAEAVRQMLAHADEAPRNPVHESTLVENTGGGKRSEFAEELLKKINYLDIALELETNKKDLPYLEILERPVRPVGNFFPKTATFVIGGLLAGFLFSGLFLGFMELKRATVMTPAVAAGFLEVPYLGSLPRMIQPDAGSSSDKMPMRVDPARP